MGIPVGDNSLIDVRRWRDGRRGWSADESWHMGAMEQFSGLEAHELQNDGLLTQHEVLALQMCRIWKKTPATSGLICGNSTIVARPLHLLGVGRRDGGERGGLCGIRGVAEGLGILETGHVGTEAREQAVVRPRLLGGGGNLAAALDNVAEVIRGAHSLAPPGRELAPFVEKPDADDVSIPIGI